jgi:hypothetical protein
VVAAGRGRVVGEGLEPPGRIVGIGGQMPGAGGAAARPVVAEGRDRSAAVLADPDRPAARVQVVGEEGAVGMGDPDPVAVAKLGAVAAGVV